MTQRLGGLTYGHFTLTGMQDCGNVYDPDDFDLHLPLDTPRAMVDETWKRWEADGMKEQWIEDNADVFDDLDPEKCYEAWASGWKKCAESAIRESIEERKAATEQWYLAEIGPAAYSGGPDRVTAVIEGFDSMAEAQAAGVESLKRNRGQGLWFTILPGNLNGPYEYGHLWPEWKGGMGARRPDSYSGEPSTRGKKINPAQRALISNPAWVTKAISSSYMDLEKKIPAAWLPKLQDVKSQRGTMTAKMKEYGCGAYGCVLPTLDDKVVLKITTDATEADFAGRLAPTLHVPVTCAYFKVASLPGKHKGNRMYLLWREEASKVDAIDKEPYGKRAVAAIRIQHKAAQAVFDLARSGKRSPALAAAVEKWRTACVAMGKVPQLKYLSDGMLEVFTEQCVFFGDVHEGNVGQCMRDGRPEWVITDPGHVSVI